MRKRSPYKKLWEEAYGKVPRDYEVHHKIPRHLGGVDELENFELVTKDEHKQRHLDLYKKYGNFRDLCAYHMIGYNFTEAHRISSGAGGKIGGKTLKQRGGGIFAISPEQHRENSSAGGKIGTRKQITLKLGIHTQDVEKRLQWSSLGGLTSCKSNGFRDPEAQRIWGRRGGPKNKGFKWYTDGISDLKYTQARQLYLSFEDFLLQNEGKFRRGRHETPFRKKAR